MGALLFVCFVVVPILELAVIIQVGQVAGVVPTIVALIAVSLIGAALVRREGLRAWNRVGETLRAGRMPAQEVVDGALVLAGGALMLTPGFLTDAVGLLLVIPVTRALANRLVRTRVRSIFLPGRASSKSGSQSRAGGGTGWQRGSHGSGSGPGSPRGHGDDVVDVDVVGIERNGREQPPGEARGEAGDDGSASDDGGSARNGGSPKSP